jgi:uncharacterized protein YecT (DUF1311 family)
MIAAATLLLIAQAGATEAVDECIDPQAQQQMNYCAARDFAAADAALNEQWELTVAAMKDRDTMIDRANDRRPGSYELLLEGQRAWLKYRDAQCQNEGYYARGGSLEPLLVAQCRTYLTELRTQQLRHLAVEPDL